MIGPTYRAEIWVANHEVSLRPDPQGDRIIFAGFNSHSHHEGIIMRAIKSGAYCPWNLWIQFHVRFQPEKCPALSHSEPAMLRKSTQQLQFSTHHQTDGKVFGKNFHQHTRKNQLLARLLIWPPIRRLSDQTPSDGHRMIIGRLSDRPSDKLSDE